MTDVVDLEYVDFKNIKTRQCIQIVLECDIINAQRVFDLLGYPSSGETKHVAVALLKTESVEDMKKRFHELPPAQQAGIKSNDDEFMGWFNMYPMNAYGGTREGLKNYLNISSFTQLNQNKEKWQKLLEDYVEYKRQNG